MSDIGRSEGGFSLIEVLVSVVILSLGLLGVAGMQVLSLQSGHSAYQRSQATWVANDLADRLRARRDDACSLYADDSDDGDRADWNNTLLRLLGSSANGSLAVCNNDQQVEIHISWNDERGNIKGVDGDATAQGQSSNQTFVFRTRL